MIRTPLRLAALVAATALVPSPAGATTSGGHITSRPQGPVLIGDMAVLGVAREQQPEWMAPIAAGVSLYGVSAPPPVGRPARGGATAAADAFGPVALAGGSSAGAVAWRGGGGLASALVASETLALTDRVDHPVAGSLRAVAVAAPANAGHVVAWSDDGGLHARWVAPGGTAGDPVAVTGGPARSFRLTAASDGRAWLVWSEGGSLHALRLAADGTAERFDAGPVPARWQQRAGSAGDLWILVRSPAGSTLWRLGASAPAAGVMVPGAGFLDASATEAVVASPGQSPRRAVVHRFGVAHTRTRIKLPSRSALAGLAVEPGGRTHLMLRAGGDAALLSPGAAPTLLARRSDPRGAVAGTGVVAVATSRVYHEEENEDGGGSSAETMRYETLHVLAGHRVAKIRAILDGYDSF